LEQQQQLSLSGSRLKQQLNKKIIIIILNFFHYLRSTVIGTGAAATGAIVTVPGFLKTRNQSIFLGTYLLKIHNKCDEFCKTTKPTNKDKNKNEYLDFLDALLCDIIFYYKRD
jgi:hypothetical protein